MNRTRFSVFALLMIAVFAFALPLAQARPAHRVAKAKAAKKIATHKKAHHAQKEAQQAADTAGTQAADAGTTVVSDTPAAAAPAAS